MRPIYYDTETTGVKSDRDRIIEIAAYDPLRKESFVSFIYPEVPIPPEASAISKITDSMVKDAPLFKPVFTDFINFCGPDAVLIAHNNDNFDRPFLEAECRRAGMTIPEWKYVDSLKWARKYRADLPKHPLQHLRDVYEIKANQAHRALDDVMVLYQVFTCMTDDLPIETILSLLSYEKKGIRMPFGKHQGKELDKVPKDYVQWLSKTGAFDKSENKDLKSAFEALSFI